jgi:hypothetical protein
MTSRLDWIACEDEGVWLVVIAGFAMEFGRSISFHAGKRLYMW